MLKKEGTTWFYTCMFVVDVNKHDHMFKHNSLIRLFIFSTAAATQTHELAITSNLASDKEDGK